MARVRERFTTRPTTVAVSPANSGGGGVRTAVILAAIRHAMMALTI